MADGDAFGSRVFAECLGGGAGGAVGGMCLAVDKFPEILYAITRCFLIEMTYSYTHYIFYSTITLEGENNE